MEKQSFGKHERICKRKDYLTIYEQGARRHSRHFTIIKCRNQMGNSRLGITVTKKIGNAVKRNRIKRLLREFFRVNKSRLSSSQDIVVIAKKEANELSYHALCRELEIFLIEKSDA